MIELVNKTTGERIDLRFVDGLSIDLGDVSPEVYAAFQMLERQRRAWRAYVESVQRQQPTQPMNYTLFGNDNP